jgi:hypothetical protein
MFFKIKIYKIFMGKLSVKLFYKKLYIYIFTFFFFINMNVQFKSAIERLLQRS